jgi:hypothetical protein
MYTKSHKNRAATRETATLPLGFATARWRMPEARWIGGCHRACGAYGGACLWGATAAPLGSHLHHAFRSGSLCASGWRNCRRRATGSGSRHRCTFGSRNPHCRVAGDLPPRTSGSGSHFVALLDRRTATIAPLDRRTTVSRSRETTSIVRT